MTRWEHTPARARATYKAAALYDLGWRRKLCLRDLNAAATKRERASLANRLHRLERAIDVTKRIP